MMLVLAISKIPLKKEFWSASDFIFNGNKIRDHLARNADSLAVRKSKIPELINTEDRLFNRGI